MQTEFLHPFLRMLSRVIIVPITFGAVILVRHGREGLEVLSSDDQALVIKDGTIRTRVLLRNPTRREIEVERIDLTVTDALGTFTLRNEGRAGRIAAGTCMEKELVATNFQPLRLSRECTYRARFYGRSGLLCTVVKSFTNIWPCGYFGDDDTQTVIASSFPVLHDFAGSTQARPHRRREEIEANPG